MKRFEKTINNKKGNIITNNIKTIIGFIAGLLIGLLIMGIMWPDRIAKLSNGEELILTLDKHNITANDLYERLKTGGSLTAALNLADEYILKDKYDLESEATKYAKEQSESIIKEFESNGFSKVEFLENNNFKDMDDFIDYLHLNYYYETYYDEYTESLLKDDDINDYYKDDVFGDKKVVLFSSSNSEKSLENVRSALKKKMSVSNIKKKYDDVTVNELTLTYKDYLNYSEDLWKKVKSLNKGQYSEIVEDSTLGYVVVYVTSTSEKPELKDIKDDIVDLLVSKNQDEDKKLFYQAFIALRDSYNINFKDTSLKKEYEEFKKAYK